MSCGGTRLGQGTSMPAVLRTKHAEATHGAVDVAAYALENGLFRRFVHPVAEVANAFVLRQQQCRTSERVELREFQCPRCGDEPTIKVVTVEGQKCGGVVDSLEEPSDVVERFLGLRALVATFPRITRSANVPSRNSVRARASVACLRPYVSWTLFAEGAKILPQLATEVVFP